MKGRKNTTHMALKSNTQLSEATFANEIKIFVTLCTCIGLNASALSVGVEFGIKADPPRPSAPSSPAALPRQKQRDSAARQGEHMPHSSFLCTC
eukprot:285148-Rhodomonas_salina.1